MRKQNLKNYRLPKIGQGVKIYFHEMIWQVFFKPIVSSSLPGTYLEKIYTYIIWSKIRKIYKIISRNKNKNALEIIYWRLFLDRRRCMD